MNGPKDKDREIPPVADDPLFREQGEEWRTERGNESEESLPQAREARERGNESVESSEPVAPRSVPTSGESAP